MPLLRRQHVLQRIAKSLAEYEAWQILEKAALPAEVHQSPVRSLNNWHPKYGG
jgi:hypothetical protein